MVETNIDANIDHGGADNDDVSSVDASNKVWSNSSASSVSELTASTIFAIMDDCAVNRYFVPSTSLKRMSKSSKLIEGLKLIFGINSSSSLQSDDSFFSYGTEWLSRPDSVVLANQRGVSRVSRSQDSSTEDAPSAILIEECIGHASRNDIFLNDFIQHLDHEFEDCDSVSIAKRRLGGGTKAENFADFTEEEEGEVYDGTELIVPWPSSRLCPDEI